MPVTTTPFQINQTSRTSTRAVEGSVVDRAIIQSALNREVAGGDPLFNSVDPNILKNYASHTYRWVLAALTPEQAESGSYKESDSNLTPGSMVIGTGGYAGPTTRTGPTRLDNLRSETFYGVPEFYINNVEIKVLAGMVAAAGGSGNFSCKFEVIEPHSLGLFLQSVQAAALRTGFGLNYVQCPFMLRCDFLGWELTSPNLAVGDSLPKNSSKVIASRHFVINIREIKFTASEAGSIYQVEAIHKDNTAFSNVHDSPITGATSVSGKTVREILSAGDKSLQAALNAARKQLKDKALDGQPDEYQIEFAEDLFGADVFKAPPAQGTIGNSKFSSTMADPPSLLAGSEADASETKARDRDKNQLSVGTGAFQFNNGQSITDMIKEIMLHSDYAHKALANINSDDGMVNWFRISANVNFKEEADAVKYRLKKIIRYIVTPYKIHHSLFKHPSKKAVGFDKLRRLIKRKYDYLFTGENDDIIKWELKFDGSWYTAMDPSGSEGTDAHDPSRSAAMDPVTAKRVALGTPRTSNLAPGAAQSQRITNSYRLEFDRTYLEQPLGGAYADTAAVKAARQFQKAALESKDLVRIQMEILGDPYYMAESGTIDVSMVPSAENPFITNSGIMTSEVTEIRTFVRFKTPIDVPAIGSLYEFPSNGNSYSPFSGLYRIVIVTHMFKDGQFSQILDMIRDRDQPLTTEISTMITDSNLNFFEDSFTVDKASANSSANGTAKN